MDVERQEILKRSAEAMAFVLVESVKVTATGFTAICLSNYAKSPTSTSLSPPRVLEAGTKTKKWQRKARPRKEGHGEGSTLHTTVSRDFKTKHASMMALLDGLNKSLKGIRQHSTNYQQSDVPFPDEELESVIADSLISLKRPTTQPIETRG